MCAPCFNIIHDELIKMVNGGEFEIPEEDLQRRLRRGINPEHLKCARLFRLVQHRGRIRVGQVSDDPCMVRISLVGAAV